MRLNSSEGHGYINKIIDKEYVVLSFCFEPESL